ncbi:MAG: mechanosensitive ion channel [Anaerolineae bacterium]|nr:mechanosensitive ion channel [Anaerolineae bacterium]
MDINISAALNKINEMINSLIAALPNLVIAALVMVLFYLGANWIKSLSQSLANRYDIAPNASLLVGRLARWLTLFFGVLVALSIIIPSFEPGQLIELLGIGGIAIGFAFRDIAQNFLAGILILLTRPFKLGDQIIVGDYEGTIEEIQTRATTIKTYDGRRVVIPNADLFTDSVIVNTAFDIRRSQYDVGVGYDADIETARKVMLDVLNNTEGVLSDPAPDVILVALDSSSVNLRARWWTDSQRSSVVKTQNKVITRIKYKLDENGIDIPFPIRTVFFHDETKKRDDPESEPSDRQSQQQVAAA